MVDDDSFDQKTLRLGSPSAESESSDEGHVPAPIPKPVPETAFVKPSHDW